MLIADITHTEDTSSMKRTYRISKPHRGIPHGFRQYVHLDEVAIRALKKYLGRVGAGPKGFTFKVTRNVVRITREPDCDSWVAIANLIEPEIKKALKESFQRQSGRSDAEVV